MTFAVRITAAAWADAESVYLWIKGQGEPRNAARWFNGWLANVTSLERLPRGRPAALENGVVPGVKIHQQLYGSFRSLYIVRGKQVFILHVRRGCRALATGEDLQAGMDEALD